MDNPFASAPAPIKGFDCSTCYDTNVIDHGGREIKCENCADYRPSAVTVVPNDGSYGVRSNADHVVLDNSYVGPRYIYAAGTKAHCDHRATKRRAVIKAALTRRANKAKAKA